MCVYMEKNLENVEKKWDILPYSFDQFGIRQKPSPTKKLIEPPPEAISTSINVDFLQAKMGPPQQRTAGLLIGLSYVYVFFAGATCDFFPDMEVLPLEFPDDPVSPENSGQH